MADLLKSAINQAVWNGNNPLETPLPPNLEEERMKREAAIPTPSAPNPIKAPAPSMPPAGSSVTKGFSAGPTAPAKTRQTMEPTGKIGMGVFGGGAFKATTITTQPVDRLKLMYGGEWMAKIDEARRQNVPDEVTEQVFAEKEAQMLEADIDPVTIDQVFGRTPEMRKGLYDLYSETTAKQLAAANSMPIEDVQNTLAVAATFGVTPSLLFNYPQLNENLVAKMKAAGIEPTKGTWQSMKDAWFADDLNVERNRLRGRSMIMHRDNTEAEKAQIASLDKQIAKLSPQVLKQGGVGGFVEESLAGLSGLASQMINGFKMTFSDAPVGEAIRSRLRVTDTNVYDNDSFLGRLGNKGINNLYGDQVLREGVGIYDELEDDRMPNGEPLPQNIRSWVSIAGGLASGAVGTAQMGTVVGALSKPLTSTAARGAITTAIKSRTFKAILANALLDAGIDYTKEVGEEVAQRAIAITARELGRYIAGSTSRASVSDIADDLATEGIEAAKAMAGFGFLGALKSAAQAKVANSQVQARALNIDIRGAHRDAQQTLRSQATMNIQQATDLNQQMRDQAAAGIDFESPLNVLTPEEKLDAVRDVAAEAGISPEEAVELAEEHDLNNAAAAMGEDVMTERSHPIDPNDTESVVYIPREMIDSAMRVVNFQDAEPDADLTPQMEERYREAGVSEEGIQALSDASAEPGSDVELSEADYAKVRNLIGDEAASAIHEEMYGAKEFVTAEERMAQIAADRAARQLDPLAGDGEAAIAARAIQQTVFQQMTDAGVKKSEAQSLSTLWATHLLTMSELTNLSPDEMTNLVVRQATPEERGTFPGKAGMSIQSGMDNIIALFKSKDHSTLSHEVGHAIYNNMAMFYEHAPDDFKQQWKSMSDWLGVKEGQTQLTDAQNEKFANGFTKYLQTGKAPTKGLQKVFNTIARWMKRLMRNAKLAGLELSDAATGFYNALLSTKLEADDVIDVSNDLGALEVDLERSATEAKILERKNEELVQTLQQLELSEEELSMLNEADAIAEPERNITIKGDLVGAIIPDVEDVRSALADVGVSEDGINALLGEGNAVGAVSLRASDLLALINANLISKEAMSEILAANEMTQADMDFVVLRSTERASIDAATDIALDREEAATRAKIDRQTKAAYRERATQERIANEMEVNSLLRQVDRERAKQQARAERAEQGVAREVARTEREVARAEVKAQTTEFERGIRDTRKDIATDIRELKLRQRTIERINSLVEKNKKRISEIRARYKKTAEVKKGKEKESSRQRKIIKQVDAWMRPENQDKITVEARRELRQIFEGKEVAQIGESVRERRAAIRRMIATGQTTYDTLQSRLDAEKAAKQAARESGVKYRKTEDPLLPVLQQRDLDHLYSVNIFTLPIEEQTRIMEDAKEVYDWGVTQRIREKQAVKDSVQSTADAVAENMGGYQKVGRQPGKEYAKDKVPFWVPDKYKKWYLSSKERGISPGEIIRSVLTPGRMYDLMDGGTTKKDGPMYNQFINERNRHKNKALRNIESRIGEPMERMMKEVGIDGVRLNQEMGLGVMPPVENVFGPGFNNPTWQQGIAMTIYASNATDMRHMVEGNFGAKTDIEVQQITDYISKVVQVVKQDDASMAMLNYMVNDMNDPKRFAEMQRVAENVLNIEVNKVEGYFPRRFKDKVESDEAEGHVQVAGTNIMQWFPGFLKDRLDKTQSRPLRLDAVTVYLESVKDQEMWTNMAEWHRDSVAMLMARKEEGGATLAETIREKFGSDGIAFVRSELDDYVMPQYKKSDETLHGVYGALAILMKNRTIRALCFRLGPYIKNFINFDRVLASEAHLGAILSVCHDAMTDWDTFSKKVEARDAFIASRDAAYVSSQVRVQPGAEGIYAKTLELGLDVFSKADRVVASVMSEAYYRGYVDNGMDPEVAAVKAMGDVQAMQQPAHAQDLPMLWRTNNPVLKALLQFTTETAIQHGIVFYDIVRGAKQAIMNRDSAAAEMVARKLTIVMLEATMMNLIVFGFPDDDEDESWGDWFLKGAATYVFGAVPLIGSQFLAALYNERSFGDAFIASIPFSKLISGFRKALTGSSGKITPQGYSERESGLWELADSISNIVPYPYEAIRGLRKISLAGDMEGNTFANMLGLMINNQTAAKRLRAMAKEQNKMNKRLGFYPKED